MTKTSNQKKSRPEKIQKQKKIKHCNKSQPLKKTTLNKNWEKPQIINYIVYVIAFGDHFKKGPQMTQIYEDMAKYIGNGKTPQQCRRYHSKNRIFFKSLDKIIECFVKKYQQERQCIGKEAERIKQEKEQALQELFYQSSKEMKSEDLQQYAPCSEQLVNFILKDFYPSNQGQVLQTEDLQNENNLAVPQNQNDLAKEKNNCLKKIIAII